MAQKKKLQVFVSSTYADLREERQAAVEAILTAGHIPAGMELFTAGDQSQMQVIKRWIDESDVFLLILGGRYGSIEPESQKSYIHLEYEYAIEQQKPSFAVVIDENHLDEKVRTSGRNVLETDNPLKLKEFRASVRTRMVRFWSDPRDIKLAILETLSEFSRRDNLVGWIPANEVVNTGALAEEIARLTKENAVLREQLANSPKETATYNGLSYYDMYSILSTTKANLEAVTSPYRKDLERIAEIFADDYVSLIHYLFLLRRTFFYNEALYKGLPSFDPGQNLKGYGLIEYRGPDGYSLTDQGRRFLFMMLREDKAQEAQRQGF